LLTNNVDVKHKLVKITHLKFQHHLNTVPETYTQT